MRYFLSITLLLIISTITADAQLCYKNGKKLMGKVRITNSFPDFKVRITDNLADLDVTPVNRFAVTCGQWEFVDTFEDFSVQFVSDFADFTIYMVPGNPYPTESEFKADAGCEMNGKKLFGRVKVVDDFADFKVKIEKMTPDLEVKLVNNRPDKCGLWHFVDNHEDFTIQFVEEFADFTIQFRN